jgi:hypothetical protein
MASILLQRSSGGGGSPGESAWKFDSDLNLYYLEIDGNRVSQIDSNGNIIIPGRVLSSE